MRTLSEKQAEFLRGIRKGLAEEIRVIQDKIIAVRLNCGHDEQDKNCPICDIYAKAEPESYIDSNLLKFATAIDFHLQRGPSV